MNAFFIVNLRDLNKISSIEQYGVYKTFGIRVILPDRQQWQIQDEVWEKDCIEKQGTSVESQKGIFDST